MPIASRSLNAASRVGESPAAKRRRHETNAGEDRFPVRLAVLVALSATVPDRSTPHDWCAAAARHQHDEQQDDDCREVADGNPHRIEIPASVRAAFANGDFDFLIRELRLE